MIKLGDLFTVSYGHSLELNRLERSNQADGVAFVSRKMGDNGISGYVAQLDGLAPNPGGSLTCALSGNGVLSTFIQDSPYYTGFHVACLSPKTKLSQAQLLYYCTCIAANRYKYSWGRQANRTVRDIVLPSPSDMPHWVEHANTDLFAGAGKPASAKDIPKLDISNWQPFMLQQLFKLTKGKRLTKADMQPGKTPFIGSTDSQNGVTAFVGQPAIHAGNTISVAYNGSVAETFYQAAPFWATDDVNVLYPSYPGLKLTPSVGLFICALIRLEKFRFNYGRKWHLDRMKSSIIRLPVTKTGDPDWKFMERYIKSLPYSSQIQ